MTRETAIKHAVASVETGEFRDRLARRVARATESQSPDHRADLTGYLEQELVADLVNLGFECRIEVHEGWPFLIAQRIEDPARMTVLGYGHGDVVGGMDAHWDVGLSPWTLVERDNRWYGRGTADNKGQHTINLLALQAVIRARGHLGFNAKFLFEIGGRGPLAGAAQFCRGTQIGAVCGPLSSIRWAKAFRRPADHLPRIPRRHVIRHVDRCAHGRSSFG